MRFTRLKSFINFLLLIVTGGKPLCNVNAMPKWLNRSVLLEHQVTAEEAKQAARNFHLYTKIPYGCKECMKSEIQYCLSKEVLHDHCCCDHSKYQELFPYIEHACSLEENLCEPIARNCGEYARVVECCCHRYLIDEWNANYLRSEAITTSSHPPIFTYLFINFLYIFSNKFEVFL